MSTTPQADPVIPAPSIVLLNPGVESFKRHIARQPILDREQRTQGYELLFRSGPEDFFCSKDPDSATCQTIDVSLLLGSEALTGGLPSYINCTRNILLQEMITVLPRDRVVVEVLESVLADAETIAACARLRRAGYIIALDDYVPNTQTMRLLPYADLVKVDFLATNSARQAAVATEMRRRGIRLLAEKIETREQFDFALRLGYQYFQGYFFCKPQTLTIRDIAASKLTYVQVLNIVSREEFKVDELEKAILREPSLCYRLLRYLNSAAFGLFPVRSIRHALSLLGQREIQKWIAIVVAVSIASDRPAELISYALTRARSCEAMAAVLGEQTSAAFMTGLLSLMDAILDRPMEQVIAQLPIGKDCKDALCGVSGPLNTVLQIAVSCERGNWEQLSETAGECAISEETTWEIYRDACHWSDQILKENMKEKQ